MTPEDRAQEIELAEYERNQAKGILPVPNGPSAKYCTDASCGDEIPESRRKAIPGVLFCVDCQQRREHTQLLRMK
ncbi:MAG: TraR/DksA C4-type zinc finger protein [Sulfurimicrobium sp.]|nr:TraR/DksA C4-type zinc finger protein [Sulfurimicrobium sp.]